MKAEEITNELQRIASSNDFAVKSAELTESWSSANTGIEAVEPILRFMEEHPSIDFGMPGALVHFVERFNGKGYDEKLIESVERRPVAHTVWMLNRLINGTRTSENKRHLVAVMEHLMSNPLADKRTVALATRFLERLSN